MNVQISSHNNCSTLVLFTFVFITMGITTYSKPHHGIITILHEDNAVINEDSSKSHQKGVSGEDVGRELYPLGSSLPDCTHACGVCSPCKRVTVSFICASESCPVVYRCLCNGKYYHVPSSK
ncbi:hypothetical protein RND81_02G073500 [Saponaria officinalis]|uniref:Epidermal patterning factor-like protein n=1 Tax=Saponaria officinalis TaxID=3572 RepID=A0AAW1ML94_SAPOF